MEAMDTAKKVAKKVWWFIWEDDSYLSWFANFVLAFLLIKFIVYPGLGAILGTGFPVVAVVSGSMEHDGSFTDWWESDAQCAAARCTQEEWYANYAIDSDDFDSFLFTHGFNKGDIMVLSGVEPQNIKIGDVIVFVHVQSPEPIIHRVVAIEEQDESFVYQTKGDHNVDSGSIDMNIHEDAVLGKAIFRIPILGWVKIAAVELVALFV